MPAAVVGVLYPCDPAGNGVGGIESFVRGLVKFAPPDIRYHVFGATLDDVSRPVGRVSELALDGRTFSFEPLIKTENEGVQSRLPATIRYEWAAFWRRPDLSSCQLLESHRIEHLFLRARRKKPFNLFLHQNMEVIYQRHSDIRWRYAPKLYERMEKTVLQSAGSVFVVREDAVSRYRDQYPQIAEKVHFLPTWTDTEIFFPMQEEVRRRWREEHASALGINSGSELVVTVGRIDKQKDPLLMITAFARVAAERQDSHLIWIGDGVMRSTAEAAVQRLGLGGKVHFVGKRAPSDIARALNGCDLFALSSAYEGMPIALSEALACGTPAVSTDVGEVRRLIHDGINGRVCQHGDAAGLAEIMNWGLNNVMTIRGRACTDAVEPYKPQRVLAPVHDAYRQLAKGT